MNDQAPPRSDSGDALPARGSPTWLAHRRQVWMSIARAALLMVALLVIYFLTPAGSEDAGSPARRGLIALLLMITVIVAETVAVAKSATPALRAIEAVGVSLTVLLVTSALVHLLISAGNPDAYTEQLDHVGALYLSMMTMTTVGFGDIGALSQGARLAVMVEMVLNVLVLGVAVRAVLSRAKHGAWRASEH